MKINVWTHEKVVQLRMTDHDMSLFDKLKSKLISKPGVKFVKKLMTFETSIIDYEYQGIEFSLLFDEQEDETFVTIIKPFDYLVIQNLIEALA